MTQHTEHQPTLHAYLSYQDAPAALRWLERAFGFETTMEFPDEQGGIAHAEQRLGNVGFTVFTDDQDRDRARVKGETVGHGLYVSLAAEADVDKVHTSAVAAGATVIWQPASTEWGNYRCRVLDIEGYEWTFGTYVPGAPATDSW